MKMVKGELPVTYKLGLIGMAPDGTWTIYWYGEHADDGGNSFGPGHASSPDLNGLLKSVAKNMNRCKKIYLEKIKSQATEAENDVFKGDSN